MSKRGRPSLYNGVELNSHIANLVAKYGLTGAKARLSAEDTDSLHTERDLNLVPKAIGISLPTISKIAKQAGIELKRGRKNIAKPAKTVKVETKVETEAVV